MVRRHRFMALLAGATLIGSGLVVTAPAYAGTASATQAGAAPGAPGAASYFNLARKDCVGTAAGRGSKVWYTVAGGVLSDVYEPTIDNTDVSTLQYVVTDGATFSDLQTRDMTYTVAADANLKNLHVYARLDAHVNGNGGGGTQNAGANSGVVDTSTGSPIPVIFSTSTVTNAVNRNYAVPTYLALAASTPIITASVGYAGTASDGLTQLDASRALTSYTEAPDGHIVATEAVTPGHGGQLTLALGFGRTQSQAVATAGSSLSRSFDR